MTASGKTKRERWWKRIQFVWWLWLWRNIFSLCSMFIFRLFSKIAKLNTREKRWNREITKLKYPRNPFFFRIAKLNTLKVYLSISKITLISWLQVNLMLQHCATPFPGLLSFFFFPIWTSKRRRPGNKVTALCCRNVVRHHYAASSYSKYCKLELFEKVFSPWNCTSFCFSCAENVATGKIFAQTSSFDQFRRGF